MKKAHDTFDWVGAAFALAQADSTDIGELVRAAGLDPINGDLACADFSGLDLSNQNMEGWNLEQATWRNAKVAGTKLEGATLRADNFIQAKHWKKAKLSAYTIADINLLEKEIEISIRISFSETISPNKKIYIFTPDNSDEIKIIKNKLIKTLAILPFAMELSWRYEIKNDVKKSPLEKYVNHKNILYKDILWTIKYYNMDNEKYILNSVNTALTNVSRTEAGIAVVRVVALTQNGDIFELRNGKSFRIKHIEKNGVD
jgi:hypothetical protein